MRLDRSKSRGELTVEMEAYSGEYVGHNLPFILLSGLEGSSETEYGLAADSPYLRNGIKIASDQPLCSGRAAQHLRDEFIKTDATHRPWLNGIEGEAARTLSFKMRAVGRVGRLHVLDGYSSVSLTHD